MNRDKLQFTEGKEQGVEELERAEDLISEALSAIANLHYAASSKDAHEIIGEAHEIVLNARSKVFEHRMAERQKCWDAWREAINAPAPE